MIRRIEDCKTDFSKTITIPKSNRNNINLFSEDFGMEEPKNGDWMIALCKGCESVLVSYIYEEGVEVPLCSDCIKVIERDQKINQLLNGSV